VQCPKETQVELSQGALPGGPSAHCCPQCQGAWIPPEHYADWQSRQGIAADTDPYVAVLPSAIAFDFEAPALDNRAALCPDCRHYLVRGRVTLQNTAFFVERCPNCKGYWCDGGEWGILQELGLHSHLNFIFADSWQTQVKALEATQRERQATIDKLGPDIAAKIFELADLLEQHPNGDFGVAYLMRRFEE
jgi:Zn-finger nucleic acid-binding protein